MGRHLVGLFLSGVLILLSLPFFAVSFLIASICASVAWVLPQFHRPSKSRAVVRHQVERVSCSGYDHAIGNYADLIGAHAWKRP